MTDSPLRVGVIDDYEGLRRSFTRLLNAVGMQPTCYASAEEFLVDPHRPEFDCLLLDVQLPGMSGLDLASALASSGSNTPVILMTALDEEDERVHALKMGCFSYFRKSESAKAILEAVRNAAAQYRIGKGFL